MVGWELGRGLIHTFVSEVMYQPVYLLPDIYTWRFELQLYLYQWFYKWIQTLLSLGLELVTHTQTS